MKFEPKIRPRRGRRYRYPPLWVLFPELRIAYHSIPKAGSTTIKMSLFRAAGVAEFPGYEHNGRWPEVHYAMFPSGGHSWRSGTWSPERLRRDGYTLLTCIRDPYARLVSAVRGDLQQLVGCPDARKLHWRHMARNEHLALQRDLFTCSLGEFDHIFRVRELGPGGPFHRLLLERGREFVLPHGNKGRRRRLSRRLQRRLRRLAAPDYGFLGDCLTRE